MGEVGRWGIGDRKTGDWWGKGEGIDGRIYMKSVGN